MKTITLEEAAKFLIENDNYIVLMHKSPDGDAVGSAYGLCTALRSIGKKANPLCGDEIPLCYSYITEGFEYEEFEEKFIISVDLASISLLSGKAKEYSEKVDLCIDHHFSNTGYAKAGYVDGEASSCSEIIKELLDHMKANISKDAANALFTGICTDTGCFKYSSVSPKTHRISAELMELGADSAKICKLMFDTKSKEKLELEKMVIDTLEYFDGGKIAMLQITNDIMKRSGAEPGDTESIASIPCQISGVKIGITMKEKENGEYRFSVRTTGDNDACEICKNFGGGGHKAAAGCSIFKEHDAAKADMLAACKAALGDK